MSARILRPIGAISLVAALLLGFAVPAAYADSVTFGLYAAGGYISPTLELSLPAGGYTLDLRAQKSSFMATLSRDLFFGPAGLLTLGGQAALGGTGWGGRVYARGGLSAMAVDARLAYASTPWPELWVGDSTAAGFSGALAGRYRLGAREVLSLGADYNALWTFEASYAWRVDPTYTLGLGWRQGPYARMGWKGTVDSGRSLLELLLLLGKHNQLGASLFQRGLKAGLTVNYPFAVSLSLERDGFAANLDYTETTNTLGAWLRYRLTLGGDS